jgi:Flp pilus assembly protein CpaB
VKRSNRLVILVGVLLAVLAFVAIVILLNNQPDGGPTGGPDTEPDTATVLVAAVPIGIGAEVTPEMVEESEIPVEAVQLGALLDVSQLAGRTAVRDLPAGAQVTELLFGDQSGTVDIEGQLLPGEKAFAVQFDPVTGMNFLVQQGDHVDIILTLDFASGTIAGSAHLRPNDTEIVRTVKAVLQNKRVLYVSATNIPPAPVVDEEGNEVPPPETVAPSSIIVIFAGTDADAELFTFAQRGAGEVGSLTMTLRQSDDEAPETTEGVTLADIFETYGLVIPTEVEELASPEEPAP